MGFYIPPTREQALQHWQSLRSLPSELRIEALMASFFSPPPVSDIEYAAIERIVMEEMACEQSCLSGSDTQTLRPTRYRRGP